MGPCPYCANTASHSHHVELLGTRILVDGNEWRPRCRDWCGESWTVLAKMKPIPRHWSGRGDFQPYCFCTRECSDSGRPLNPGDAR